MDRAAEEAQVRENIALVHYAVADMAKRVPQHVNRADLVSAGMIGLAQAARSFDPLRGMRFDRYAATRIRGSLLDELRRKDWASRNVRSRARKVDLATQELAASLGRTPTRTEIAARVGMEVAAVDALAGDVDRAVVLNYEAVLDSADGESILPRVTDTPESIIVDRERRAYLVDAVAALPARLRRIVVGCFFEDLSIACVAADLGISESRVSQLRVEALALLKLGVTSQFGSQDTEGRPVTPLADDEMTARQARYHAAVTSPVDYRRRLDPSPVSRRRLYENGPAAGNRRAS